MFLIPYDRMTLHTPLNTDEVAARLSQVVDTESKWYQRHSSKKEFYGSVSAAGFSVTRRIKGQNSHLPLIRGRFYPAEEGTDIVLTFSLQPASVVFMVAFFLFLEGLSLYYRDRAGMIVLAFAYLVLHCIVYLVGYVPEKKKAEAMLKSVTGA